MEIFPCYNMPHLMKRHGLGLLNHHDDPIREYSYDRQLAMGKLEKGLDMADEWGWQVVSMKDDWNEIF